MAYVLIVGGLGERLTRKRDEFPLDGRCNSENVVYQACIFLTELSTGGERTYIGISAGKLETEAVKS